MTWPRIPVLQNVAGIAGLRVDGTFIDTGGSAGPHVVVTAPADHVALVTIATLWLYGGTIPSRTEWRIYDDTVAVKGLLNIAAPIAANNPLTVPGVVLLEPGWSLRVVMVGADASTKLRISAVWMEARWTKL